MRNQIGYGPIKCLCRVQLVGEHVDVVESVGVLFLLGVQCVEETEVSRVFWDPEKLILSELKVQANGSGSIDLRVNIPIKHLCELTLLINVKLVLECSIVRDLVVNLVMLLHRSLEFKIQELIVVGCYHQNFI